MKTFLLLLISMFALGTVAKAAKHKSVSIKKVIKAIEEDPEKALKDYALFESKFAVVETKAVSPKIKGTPPPVTHKEGYQGIVKGTTQPVISKGIHKDDKRIKYSCKLEKYKTDAGVEKIRIRITEVLK